MGFVCLVSSLAVMLPHLVADFLIEVAKKHLLVLMAKPLPAVGLLPVLGQCVLSFAVLLTDRKQSPLPGLCCDGTCPSLCCPSVRHNQSTSPHTHS